MRSHEFVTVVDRSFDLLSRMRLVLGALLVLAGVLIAVFPQILVFLLASIVISTGLGVMASGWRARGRVRGPRVIDVQVTR